MSKYVEIDGTPVNVEYVAQLTAKELLVQCNDNPQEVERIELVLGQKGLRLSTKDEQEQRAKASGAGSKKVASDSPPEEIRKSPAHESADLSREIEDFTADLNQVELKVEWTINPQTGAKEFPIRYSIATTEIDSFSSGRRGKPRKASYALLSLEGAKGRLEGKKNVRDHSYHGHSRNTPSKAFQKFKRVAMHIAKEDAEDAKRQVLLAVMRKSSDRNSLVAADLNFADLSGLTAAEVTSPRIQ